MNMLSKIIHGENAKKLELDEYRVPSILEIGTILEERKRENQRQKVIDDNKEDPVKAARQEANRILIEAQEKLKEAEAEANLIKIQKEKQLRLQLEKEYQDKLDKQINHLKQNYIQSLEELATLKNVLYNQLENQLMEMVFSVSRKVVDNEIKTAPEIVLRMLKKGFEKVKDTKQCEIKINPADYETIASKKDQIKEILKASGSIKFTKDEKIERGGCKIITEQGEISSEPSKQLDIIMSELSDEPGV